jgi:hypothetical protein
LTLLTAAALAGTARAAALTRLPSEASQLTTTGPVPPKSVRPPSGARRAVAAAGETVLGVPVYIWRDGCAPTSAGMVIGYWDEHGYPDLVAGSAVAETAETRQMIASHGTADEPGHYEDYAQPTESGGAILPDRSELPAGDEHASDSLADFMGTSFSAYGLAYGWSYTSMVGPALAAYSELTMPGVSASYENLYYGASGSEALTFDRLRQEIDAGRPLVVCVDCSGDGVTDHAVAGIGYRETNGYPEYACWDTWSAAVRWQSFRPVSSAYAWGVSSATAFSLGATVAPGGDETAPVTTVVGAGEGWSPAPVRLTFSATDEGSGVAFTEAGMYTADPSRLTGTPCAMTIDAQGEHTVRFRSVDVAGNVEAWRTCTVRIDARGPVTKARAAGVRRGARVKLRYRVDDLTPKAVVRLLVKTRSGRTRATIRLGWRGTNVLRAASWRCRLSRGTYRLVVLATDQAGNRQARAGSARLTVR